MQITQCYSFLNISPAATDDEIAAVYRQLALQYHPDKNRDRLQWAHEKMSFLNYAYSTIMGQRFSKDAAREPEPARKPAGPDTVKPSKHARPRDSQLEKVAREVTIKSFAKIRETANDALYRFFQYNLNNIIRREEVYNRGVFTNIVFVLRKTYHAAKKLAEQTRDADILHHLKIFNAMIFNFYKASECLNIIDSYADLYDVQAYRQYKQADELLHRAHKELFYDRHNRGHARIEAALSLVIQAQKLFKGVLTLFSDSSWAVETEIKLAYATALRDYVELFFTDED
jgi:curved DNA-binding protein CbpA